MPIITKLKTFDSLQKNHQPTLYRQIPALVDINDLAAAGLLAGMGWGNNYEQLPTYPFGAAYRLGSL